MVTALNLIKQWFQTGDFPTEEQFADVFDSFIHKLDGIAIADVAGLQAVLQGKSEVGHQHTAEQIDGLAAYLATWLSGKLGVSVAPIVGGVIPSQYIAGQAKEVFFYATLSAFPTPGQSDALYIARDTKVQYAWDAGGTAYEVYSAPANPVWVNTNTPSINIGQFKTNEIATPAEGLTYQEFAEKLLFEPQPPTIPTLTTSATTLPYRQQTADVDVSWSYTAGANGGAVTNIKLEVSRNNGGSWTQLLSTATPTTSFSHTGVAYSSGAAIRYRLTITNAKGKSYSRTVDVAYQTWAAPTVQLLLDRSGNREKGDMATTLSGAITRNRSNVAITGYTFQFRENGGAWQILATVPVTGNPATVTIADYDHNPTTLKTSASTIDYRCVVSSDGEADAVSALLTVTFLFRSFFGYSTTTAPTGPQVLTMGGGQLATTRAVTKNGVTADQSQYTHYFYHTDLGALINCIMNGSYSILTAFVTSTVSITNSFGVSATYRGYSTGQTAAFTNATLAFV